MSANQNAWHALSSLGGPSRPAQPQVLLKSSGKYNVTKKVLNTMQFCQNYIYINMCDKTLLKKKNKKLSPDSGFIIVFTSRPQPPGSAKGRTAMPSFNHA